MSSCISFIAVSVFVDNNSCLNLYLNAVEIILVVACSNVTSESQVAIHHVTGYFIYVRIHIASIRIIVLMLRQWSTGWCATIS